MAVAERAPVAGVDYAQCASCGRPNSGEWGVTLLNAKNMDMPQLNGCFRLCDPCYWATIDFWRNRPEVLPLRGYT